MISPGPADGAHLTTLLDGNLLVALSVVDHVHHEAARAWWLGAGRRFATTPITQGTLVRLLLRSGLEASETIAVLQGLTGHARHEFWPDDRPYDAAVLRGVVGHRQVTDSYLAALARSRAGRLATFDRGLAIAHADVAELVPG